MKRIAVIAALAVLCLAPAPAQALPPDAPIAALDQAAVAAPPQVYAQQKQLLDQQQQLIKTLVAQPAANDNAPRSSPTLGNVLGAIPWEVWAALLGTIAMVVFKLWTGPTSEKVRGTILALAEGAWYVAEKQGGSGAEKYARALDAFVSAMGGQRLKVDDGAQKLASFVFDSKSAADKVQRTKLEDAVAADPLKAPAAA